MLWGYFSVARPPTRPLNSAGVTPNPNLLSIKELSSVQQKTLELSFPLPNPINEIHEKVKVVGRGQNEKKLRVRKRMLNLKQTRTIAPGEKEVKRKRWLEETENYTHQKKCPSRGVGEASPRLDRSISFAFVSPRFLHLGRVQNAAFNHRKLMGQVQCPRNGLSDHCTGATRSIP